MAHIGHWNSSDSTVYDIKHRYPEAKSWFPVRRSERAAAAAERSLVRRYAVETFPPRFAGMSALADLGSVRRYLVGDDIGRVGDGERVYAIWSVAMGAVKIGHSKRFHARMREFRASSADLILPLASAPGDDIDEAACHVRLHGALSHSEWFFCVPETARMVRELAGRSGALLWRHFARFNEQYPED